VQVELKLLIDYNAKIFDMVYYWQGRASYSWVLHPLLRMKNPALL